MNSKQIRLILILLLLLTGNSSRAAEYSVLFVSGSHSNQAKIALLSDIAVKKGLSLVHRQARDLTDLEQTAGEFSEYDLVVFDAVSERDTKLSHQQFAPLVVSSDTRFVAIKWPENETLRKGIRIGEAQQLLAYFSNGGSENLRRMVDYLQYRLLNQSDKTVLPPLVYPQVGIYHPDYDAKVFTDLSEYLAWREHTLDGRPVIGLLFQRASMESDSTALIDDTVRRFERKGALAIPFFFELSRTSSDYTHLLRQADRVVVDLIVNFRNIHWADQRQQEFESLAVPVMHALTFYDGNQQQWEQSTQGISPTMSPFQLILPESAGVVDPWIVAATNKKTSQPEIIDYQLQHLVEKSLKVIALKKKHNRDKKLTVMVWGSRDVGASFLNVPESLSSIAAKLNQAGYNIPVVDDVYFTSRIDRILNPFYRAYELDALLNDDLAALMPVAEYLAWFNTLPESIRLTINDYWGEAKDSFMVVEREGKHQFVLPRIRAGEMLIMRQPPRADNDEEDKRLYHKGTVPMNHYYLAAYYYARAYWGSDAIIHLGTHGSHEYLPGKERGLSLYDQGNLAAWDTPIVYPFIIDDVGEAMQTKRRGRATVIAHMTPPFAAAGLHGEVADLHELMHQYKSLDEGGVKQKTAGQIVEYCMRKDLCTDIGWQQAMIDADFEGFLEALHDYLSELATENQPLGLHSFGELPAERLIISTLIQMLGQEFVDRAQSLEHHHSHSEGHHHTHAHNQESHQHITHADDLSDHTDIENLVGYQTILDYVLGEKDVSHLDFELQQDVSRGRALYQNMIAIRELPHLLDFLSGRYLPVKNGGDPIRHPETLPAGDNLYGFDAAKVPTQAAWQQGSELTETMLAEYYQKHGRYPTKLAFSLWSMETMRHYGVLEAQALSAMGVRPIWSTDGRVVGTEIIPASELQRPRVDVVLSATGLYRDAFPNVMQWLAAAVEKVAELEEENNSVWVNSLTVKTRLMAAGIAEEEAAYLSTIRLFSNESGNYGSGLGDAVMTSDSWESDDKLADLYLTRMGYFYGADDSRWGSRAPGDIDLYAQQLSGTDIALFSRSSNVYGLLASDDPFQYFGGLALAVRHLDGQSPEMFITNLRDANRAKMENAATFLAKELRTRTLHPRWVEEMKKEGYSGAVTMASTLSNFFGWQVMDPALVRDDQWQALFEVYVQDVHDLALNEWFSEVNPHAQSQIMARMLEAIRKDYWQADELTLQTLVERYQQLVTQHNLVVDNHKLREFLTDQAAGFGWQSTLPPVEIPAMDLSAAPSSQTETVTGQKLEQINSSEDVSTQWHRIFLLSLGCLMLVLLGAWRQSDWANPWWQQRPLTN
ncbi:MAG TPA: cobaltochelatase subunit CobN [Gammaproteobacteria bacterium]|nr:cobaltochelatase subunit CobN [Gammaproteobacteria bacterium]